MDNLFERASSFLELFFRESESIGLQDRLDEVKWSIESTGTYIHSKEELEFGSRVAWRNSNRCIGRLFWKSLQVIDNRGLTKTTDIAKALANHLDIAWNNGKIKPVISIFKPFMPDSPTNVSIWNPQLISYAGYENEDKTITGDRRNVEFTQFCKKLGWQGRQTPFDILPWVIQAGHEPPALFPLPSSSVHEVDICHPAFSWFRELGLKWYAIPVISNMTLEIGGLLYKATPFNGWYMGTEIGARNLADESRYNQLPNIARRMGLQIDRKNFMWRDRALLELNEAVLYSFKKSGVRMVDHHTASEQFMRFNEEEQRCGREVMADWSWIVPPLSGNTMEVFHEEWNNKVIAPNFYYQLPPWKKSNAEEKERASKCPFSEMGL